jgi:hypothetical protein
VFCALLVPACGSDGADRTTTGTGAPSPAATSAPATTITPPAQRSSPRWETVATFSGADTTDTPTFTILPGAIQWRVRWSCAGTGSLRITATPPPRRAGPIAEGECPKEGQGFAIHNGAIRLGIEVSGPWIAIVDQQIDTPVDEPLLPEMAAAPVVAEGPFYGVEKKGAGTARLYRLDDGRRVLRMEDFETAENTDLFVWLTDNSRPSNSREAIDARRIDLGNLKSTIGNQNYEVPADADPALLRSVVVWCQPVAVAYAAAALEPS